jgi:hypothetical protein
MSQFRNNLKPASGSVAIRPESSGPRKLIFRQEDRRTGYAGFTGGLWEWIGYDGMEGQRPRLNHFSITGEAEIAFRHNSRGINHGGHGEHGVENEVLQQADPEN